MRAKSSNLFLFCAAIALIMTTASFAQSATPEETYTQVRNLRKVEGKPDEAASLALAFLREYTVKDNIRQKIYYEYAAAKFQKQDFAVAKAAFLGLVDEYRNTTLDKNADDFMIDDAQYFAAMIEQTQGEKDVDRAIAAYKALVDSFPKSKWRPNALITIGDLYRGNEKWTESLESYYRLLEDYPDNASLAPAALFWSNRCLAHSDKEVDDPETEEVEDNSEEIEKNIATMLEKWTDSDLASEAVFDLVNYYNIRAEFDKAEHYCDVMFEHYPEKERTSRAILEWVDLVTRVEGEKRYDEAAEWIELVRNEALERQDAELYENALFYKGLALMRKRDRDGAIDHFRTILANYPETTIAFEIEFMIASCYMGKKDYDSAIAVLEEMLQQDLDENWPAAVTRTIGGCYHWKHDFEKAKEYYNRVLEDYPDTSWARGLDKKIKSVEEALKRKANQ